MNAWGLSIIKNLFRLNKVNTQQHKEENLSECTVSKYDKSIQF